jgi:hypothetical protein
MCLGEDRRILFGAMRGVVRTLARRLVEQCDGLA